jgi:hypothetical protein
MATPNEPNPTPQPGPGLSRHSVRNPPSPYGDYDRQSPGHAVLPRYDPRAPMTRLPGQYWFEWTPFTPAINAWRRAGWYLWQARKHMAAAATIKGFAIPGLETDHADFKASFKILIEDLDKRIRESTRVVEALEIANTQYAQAHDASRKEYEDLKLVIDNTTAAQGRGGRDFFGNPVPPSPFGFRPPPNPNLPGFN